MTMKQKPKIVFNIVLMNVYAVKLSSSEMDGIYFMKFWETIMQIIRTVYILFLLAVYICYIDI